MWALRAQPRQGGGAPFEPQDRMWALRAQPRQGAEPPLNPLNWVCTPEILKGQSPLRRVWVRSTH